MDKILALKKDKKIGLLIHTGAQMFSNGIIQNAYFMYVCFQHLGYTCQFLTQDDATGFLEYKHIPIQRLSTNPLYFDPTEFHTIITVTRGMNKDMHAYLKSHGISVIAFICGNNLMHDQEDFVRGTSQPGVTTFIGKGSVVDELWVIPSYKHSLEYLEVMRGKPAYIVPHLWSHEICDAYTRTNYKTEPAKLMYDFAKHTGKKIEIIILEPNMALFKNALIPVTASEKLHLTHPDLIEYVFVFNWPDNGNATMIGDNLTLGSKLRRFKRLSIPEILLFFNAHDTIPIFVSHQTLNSLNYLYYELMYYGYPLVHNSPDLDGCGYYYPDNSISGCVRAIMDAYTNHGKQSITYREKALAYLERVDPLNARVGHQWDQMLASVMAKTATAAAAPVAAK